MGRLGWPTYGEDLGSVIEENEKIINKIKTNKYSKKELLSLISVNNSLVKFLLENENKN